LSPALDPWGKTVTFLVGAGGLLVGAFLAWVMDVPWFAGIAIAVLAGGVAGVAAFFVQRGRLRRELAFKAVCDANGWHLARDEPGLSSFLREILPYKRGHSIRAPLALLGAVDGVAVRVVDGRFTTGSGKYQARHVVSSVAIEMPFALELTVEDEHVGHKIADALGAEDIDVESDEFSRRFWVRSPDRRTAYDVLHPGAIEFFLRQGGGKTWHWRGPWFVVTRVGRLEPQDCLPGARLALEFRELLPRHLLDAKAPGVRSRESVRPRSPRRA
jgi:hypothetical protein